MILNVGMVFRKVGGKNRRRKERERAMEGREFQDENQNFLWPFSLVWQGLPGSN